MSSGRTGLIVPSSGSVTSARPLAQMVSASLRARAAGPGRAARPGRAAGAAPARRSACGGSAAASRSRSPRHRRLKSRSAARAVLVGAAHGRGARRRSPRRASASWPSGSAPAPITNRASPRPGRGRGWTASARRGAGIVDQSRPVVELDGEVGDEEQRACRASTGRTGIATWRSARSGGRGSTSASRCRCAGSPGLSDRSGSWLDRRGRGPCCPAARAGGARRRVVLLIVPSLPTTRRSAIERDRDRRSRPTGPRSRVRRDPRLEPAGVGLPPAMLLTYAMIVLLVLGG